MQTTMDAWQLVRAAVTDQDVIDRYTAKVHTDPAQPCWYWTGALHSRTGHGRFWVGTHPLDGRSGGGGLVIDGGSAAGSSGVRSREVGIIASRFAWALHHGPDALDQAPVLAHTCDEASCQNPAHLVLSSNAENNDDWQRRRWSIGSPLRDTRGPAGRAQAIREAIIMGSSVQHAKQAGASALDRDQLPLWGGERDEQDDLGSGQLLLWGEQLNEGRAPS